MLTDIIYGILIPANSTEVKQGLKLESGEQKSRRNCIAIMVRVRIRVRGGE